MTPIKETSMTGRYMTRIHAPADGRFQSDQCRESTPSGLRRARAIADDWETKRDAILPGHGRVISIFNLDTGRMVERTFTEGVDLR